jgi:formylmethanofuran dehydrogenase subunit A
MDKSFRDEQLAKLHPEVAANSALKDMAREYTLQEIAIVTRAGPARLLGLQDRGRLSSGAAADIAVYRRQLDAQAMFTTPELVFKDGMLVAQAGRITAVPAGGTHFVTPEYDRSITRLLRNWAAHHGSVHPDHAAIGRDELCACCNGGRLLPAACFGSAELEA